MNVYGDQITGGVFGGGRYRSQPKRFKCPLKTCNTKSVAAVRAPECPQHRHLRMTETKEA